jgi:hypothetical protein
VSDLHGAAAPSDALEWFFALALSAKRAETVSNQDVLRIIEARVINLHPARTVEFYEYMRRVRFTSPDVIAMNTISVALTFVLYLRTPGCFLRHSLPLLLRCN